MERKHEKYERLVARCEALGPTSTAVAHLCEENSLKGAVEAAEMGLLKPILVGPRAKIEAVAAQFKLDISCFELIDVEHSVAAAETAVQLAREGRAELLMKGSLHTDELMAAVVKSGTGLRTGRRVSHCFIMDVPSLDRPLIITDAAIKAVSAIASAKQIVARSAPDGVIAPKPVKDITGVAPVQGQGRVDGIGSVV